MCSKNAETKTPADAPANATRFWSITRRLTLLYVASTAVLLLLSCGFLYWTLKREMDASRRAMLASKVEVLQLLVRQQPKKADVLADEVEHEASASHLFKYYIRILDPQGQVRLESSGMKDLLPASLFPEPVEAAAEPPEGIERELPPHRSFVLLSIRAPTGAGDKEKWTLQIAHDFSGNTALLKEFRRKLLTVLGVGIVFAAAAGGWVARKGMRPLVEITKAAQHITASHLHEPISVSQWPAELVELATAFDAMLNRLEDSFTRLSQFSTDLAHALRNPINNLRGEAEVALARSRTPEEYQHILVSSLEECDRLARMIDGLLFLARADDPKSALERVRFDARKQMEAVREFYEALAGEREVTVTCEGNAELTGDPMLFRRAVSNLLANALHHTAPQGSVRISVRSLDDQAVEVSVCDSGSGIASEHLPKIFDRFYRADRSPGGSGLGLAIVQSIMRLHGGSASVQSVVGQGTTATLKFPAAMASVPAGSGPTQQSGSRRD